MISQRSDSRRGMILGITAYVAASKLVPLSALGLVFYIGPTVQLVVAVWILGESFTLISLVSFGLVWLGLILMTGENLRRAAVRRFQSWGDLSPWMQRFLGRAAQVQLAGIRWFSQK